MFSRWLDRLLNSRGNDNDLRRSYYYLISFSNISNVNTVEDVRE